MTQRDQDDASLHAAFAELRTGDERHTPGFERVVAHKRSPMRFVLHPARIAIAAAIVIVAVGLYQTLAYRRNTLAVPREVIALSAWRPATDVLLEASTRSLLTQTPQLGASSLDMSGALP